MGKQLYFQICAGLASILAIVFTNMPPAYGQGQVLLDERFDDWIAFSPVYSDETGNESPGQIDFGRLWVTNDDRYLYMRIELGTEMNFQSDNDLVLYVDIDNNTATGFPTQGIGADIRYFPGLRFGFGSVLGFEFEIRHPDIGLISSPTVTASEFELLLARDLEINGVDVRMGDEIRIAWSNDLPGGDRLPENPGGIIYEMADREISLPGIAIDKKDVQDLRVISWNALQDGMFQPGRVASFERQLKAVQPDIIGFQEIYDHTAAEVRNFVAANLPGDEWFADHLGPDIFVVSKFPIISRQALFGNGAFLIDLGDRELLFIVAHLPCCDNDVERQAEADQIMGFIRDVQDGSSAMDVSPGTPIILAGDMNLVGLRKQQRTLITGDIQNENLYGPDFAPDWDGSELEDALPMAIGLPAAVTWIQPFSSFSPGRLDYILYTGSVMQLKNTYGLNTAGMTSSQLSTYGLFDFDAFNASDHLLCVADFTFDLQTDLDRPSVAASFSIFPNPARDVLYLDGYPGTKKPEAIQVVDVTGRLMFDATGSRAVDGSGHVKLDVSGLPPGFYILRVGQFAFPFVKN